MAALQRAGKGMGRGRGITGAGESCYTRRVFTSKVPNLVAVSRFVLSMNFFSRVFLISLFRNAIKTSREREGESEREREKCLIFAFYYDPQQMSIDMKFHFTAAARVLVEISPSLSPSAVTTAAAEAKCNWPLS